MIPLVAAAGTGLAKLGIGAKLASALGAAKGLVGMGAAKGAAAKGIAGGLSGGARMAGTKLASAGANAAQINPAFSSGIGKAVFGNMDKSQIAMRLAPDVMFGGLAGVMTPGDIGDKLIAGSTQAVGGGLGGIVLGRGASKLGLGENMQFMADMGGSIGGDFAGMAVGDTLMRGKDKLGGGAGQTPYERLSAEQQAMLTEQIRQQTLAGAGLIPGVQQQYF